jgi:hypothetical protein
MKINQKKRAKKKAEAKKKSSDETAEDSVMVGNFVNTHVTCDLVMLYKKRRQIKKQPTYLHKTALSKQRAFIACSENGELVSLSRSPKYISLCFIRANSCQATIVSPLQWNMLRFFHRHD